MSYINETEDVFCWTNIYINPFLWDSPFKQKQMPLKACSKKAWQKRPKSGLTSKLLLVPVLGSFFATRPPVVSNYSDPLFCPKSEKKCPENVFFPTRIFPHVFVSLSPMSVRGGGAPANYKVNNSLKTLFKGCHQGWNNNWMITGMRCSVWIRRSPALSNEVMLIFAWGVAQLWMKYSSIVNEM